VNAAKEYGRSQLDAASNPRSPQTHECLESSPHHGAWTLEEDKNQVMKIGNKRQEMKETKAQKL